MLEIILDRHVLFVLMGILTVLGIVSKCIANVTLKRLVRAAGNMNKSTHSLMRLVRATGISRRSAATIEANALDTLWSPLTEREILSTNVPDFTRSKDASPKLLWEMLVAL